MKKTICNLFSATVMFASTFSVWAAAPQGYYSSCEGKKGQSLLTALYQKISSHTTVSYKGLWDVYKTSDVYPDGKIWDMYSTKHWNPGKEQCGSYSGVGSCYNREHSFPKSWFNDASPMVSDAFHIYPTDGKVNGQRSNHPYGECSNGTNLGINNGVKALGRLGTSTFPGYRGTVFEPDDQYKGDFARSYFYMAACYNNRISSWNSDMLAHNSYPVFSSWAIDLLLKWHRQDPVSDKERDRNDAVERHQHNRNPFIDHPDLAEHIWGNKQDVAWSASGTVEPSLFAPVNGSTVNLGNTAVNVATTATVYVKGNNLTENVNVSVSDSRFTVSSNSFTASSVNSSSGAPLTISYSSPSDGTATATVHLRSGNVTSSFNVTATAYSSLTALDATDISDDSFTAHWVNIDGTDATYRLYVQFNGQDLPGYPLNVTAATGSHTVTGLDPATSYTYYVSSQTLSSNHVTVTTLAPIPSVQFLFDGDLTFYCAPGVASDIAEILVDIENIPGDVKIAVKTPFSVSLDKATWGREVSLLPDADRFYLRVDPTTAGEYTTSLVATAEGGFYNDDADVSASVEEPVTFKETWPERAQFYTNGSYIGSASSWKFTNVGVGDDHVNDRNQPSGAPFSARFGKTATSAVEMTQDKPRGAGSITYAIKKWDGDNDATVEIEYSTDGGTTWSEAEKVVLSSTKWTENTTPVNVAGNVRVRFRQTAGGRLNLGDVTISDYTLSGLSESLNYHSWDTYCRGGRLIIESDGTTGTVAVYSTDGITRFNSAIPAGETSLDLDPGLYIVVCDDFARRVLVK